jgi:alpha-tubulin suppressor-like RCC1 family protein
MSTQTSTRVEFLGTEKQNYNFEKDPPFEFKTKKIDSRIGVIVFDGTPLAVTPQRQIISLSNSLFTGPSYPIDMLVCGKSFCLALSEGHLYCVQTGTSSFSTSFERLNVGIEERKVVSIACGHYHALCQTGTFFHFYLTQCRRRWICVHVG